MMGVTWISDHRIVPTLAISAAPVSAKDLNPSLGVEASAQIVADAAVADGIAPDANDRARGATTRWPR